MKIILYKALGTRAALIYSFHTPKSCGVSKLTSLFGFPVRAQRIEQRPSEPEKEWERPSPVVAISTANSNRSSTLVTPSTWRFVIISHWQKTPPRSFLVRMFRPFTFKMIIDAVRF